MKVGICADHAGYRLKEQIKEQLITLQIEYVDFGTHSEDRCDYPDYAHQLALAVQSNHGECGIAICGTGNGMAMTLNKYGAIRAGLAWSEEIAKLVRAHNDANVLVLPARFIETAEAVRCLQAFLDTSFEGGRAYNCPNAFDTGIYLVS